MSLRRAILAEEGGFTLVEVLVTMTIAVIVLFAVLGAGDFFTKSASSADRTTAAQESSRATVRTMVMTLRQARAVTPVPAVAGVIATPIPSGWAPSRSDLVVAAYVTSATSSSPGTVKGWVRYCAATAGSQSSLIVGVRLADASDTYVPPGACSASDTTGGWRHAVMLDGTLQGPGQLFDYGSSTCSGAACLPTGPAIQAVGIRVAVGTKPGAASAFNSVTRDAVSFRNRSTS